jgi:hypothetical protein
MDRAASGDVDAAVAIIRLNDAARAGGPQPETAETRADR